MTIETIFYNIALDVGLYYNYDYSIQDNCKILNDLL